PASAATPGGPSSRSPPWRYVRRNARASETSSPVDPECRAVDVGSPLGKQERHRGCDLLQFCRAAGADELTDLGGFLDAVLRGAVVDDAGGDHVDGDALTPDLTGRRRRPRLQRPLGRGVGALSGQPALSRPGPQSDDPAMPGPPHRTQAGPSERGGT